jgi:phage baseplate assembly protein W
MGSINLTEFAKKENKLSSKPYTYVDLTLDLEPNFINNELIAVKKTYRDIKVSYDEFAIKNSLINIFNTIPGQRFLVPLFGSDLKAQLFQPITESRGVGIGKEIKRSIELWEPRVTIISIEVEGFPEEHEYRVLIVIEIERLKIRTNLTGIIGQSGFRESTLT